MTFSIVTMTITEDARRANAYYDYHIGHGFKVTAKTGNGTILRRYENNGVDLETDEKVIIVVRRSK